MSLLSIGVVGGLAFGATQAFFSDTETSTGNVLQAGAIDLLVDNDSWYFGEGEQLLPRPDLSWELDDLTGHLFFNFADLKPGDWGEDTISLHVNDNDAYACAYIDITKNDDMSSTEPELEVQGEVEEDPSDIWDGELAQELNFFFWLDDGDNVYETGELPLMSGPASSGLDENGFGKVLMYDLHNPATSNGELLGSETYHIGKVWCYGDLLVTDVTEDSTGPDVRNSGVSCSGEPVSNFSQTDNMMLDMSFYAEQARHNGEFTCPAYTGTTMSTRDLENKDDTDSNWPVIGNDDTWGNIIYSSNADTFYGTVNGQGLVPSSKYQITLNSQSATGCGFTATSLGGFGANQFQSGFWDSAYPNLNSVCVDDDEGLYNMNLIGDHYTVMTDATGKFNYAFNFTLPSGPYVDVKVLVKKMLDEHITPWVDETAVAEKNLYETAPISFTVN